MFDIQGDSCVIHGFDSPLNHFSNLQGFSSSTQPWVLPTKLESMTLDGCVSFDWDSLCSFVESHLPATPSYNLKRYHANIGSIVSSASAAAADYARIKQESPGPQWSTQWTSTPTNDRRDEM